LANVHVRHEAIVTHFVSHCQVVGNPGTGVICETWALEVAVIPAKAGIHPANLWQCAVYRLDSRFRGNDWCFELDPTQNDTTTAILWHASKTRISCSSPSEGLATR
jgi:hypothetical protein